jgi:hypothetical protein
MWPTVELPAGPALRRPVKSACSEMESGPTRPSLLGCFGPPGENRGGKIPPPLDAGGSPEKFGRSVVVGRRGNGLGVAPGDGGSDLRQKAVGGSPRVALHDGVLGRGRVVDGRPEKGSRLALKWTLRSLGLGRCSGWSRCGRRRTRGGSRWWLRHGGDGELERWGENSTVSVGRGVNNFFTSGPVVRGRVHGRWLHAQRVERWWQLVSSVGREVAGGRAAIARARSQLGRRLEASLTDGGMGGAWSLRGSRDTRRRQRREAGSGRNSGGSAR